VELYLLSGVDLVRCNVIQLRSSVLGVLDSILLRALGCDFLAFSVLDDEIEGCVEIRPVFEVCQALFLGIDFRGGWNGVGIRGLVGFERVVLRLYEVSEDFFIGSKEVHFVRI